MVLGVKLLAEKFYVREIEILGNYRLEREDILNIIKIKKGESLFKLDLEEIHKKLRQNPWVKNVAIKKQLPGTLLINIEEAVPKALLSIKKRLYLIDENGKILERISNDSIPFLPVIKDIAPQNKKAISEALKLVDALNKKNVFAGYESLEIGLESYGLTMNVDGELIKIGYGNYSEKFDRWIKLEPEIRKKGVPLKYVDLRFKDSVIVKPLKPDERGSS